MALEYVGIGTMTDPIPSHTSAWIAALITSGRIHAPAQMYMWLRAIRYAEKIAADKEEKSAFTGGMNKSQLKDTIRALSKDLKNVNDGYEFDSLLDAYREALIDCERHMPSWYFGDGQESQGIYAEIEAKRNEVT